MNRRVVRWGMAGLCALIAGVAFAWIWVSVEPDIPTRRSRAGPGRIRVPEGASLRKVADLLADSGWVRNPEWVVRYGVREGIDRKIMPGRYRINRGASPREVAGKIGSGEVEMTRVTIPEGRRVKQILPVLAESLEIPLENLQAVARDSAWIQARGIPRPSLEGYLFPETYRFAKEADTRGSLARLVAESFRRFDPGMEERARIVGLSRDDVFVLASIVQAEAARVDEMPRIAGVYVNRLRRGWRLEADPTIQYALDRTGGRLLYADLEVESPYNTYRNTGLPPGPIGSPGEDALRAVLWPDTLRREMFFVARGDGYHRFSRSLSEHNRARKEIRAGVGAGQ